MLLKKICKSTYAKKTFFYSLTLGKQVLSRMLNLKLIFFISQDRKIASLGNLPKISLFNTFSNSSRDVFREGALELTNTGRITLFPKFSNFITMYFFFRISVSIFNTCFSEEETHERILKPDASVDYYKPAIKRHQNRQRVKLTVLQKVQKKIKQISGKGDPNNPDDPGDFWYWLILALLICLLLVLLIMLYFSWREISFLKKELINIKKDVKTWITKYYQRVENFVELEKFLVNHKEAFERIKALALDQKDSYQLISDPWESAMHKQAIELIIKICDEVDKI